MIGFESAKSSLLASFYEKKLHHGILICGNKGIGKASFAKELCQEILGNSADFISDTRIIAKETDKKVIGVDAIRNCQDFLNQSSGSSGLKFLIIDSACELNKNAANALLKNLEEPKKNCFLFLITHNLSQLIPTIRSRCLIIKPKGLNSQQFFEILRANNCELAANDLEFLAEICEYAPGLAIEHGTNLVGFYRLILQVIEKQKIDEEFLKKISDKSISLSLFERVQMVFFNRLLKFLVSQNFLEGSFFASEERAFVKLAKTYSTEFLLHLKEDLSIRTTSAIHLNCDKKTNILTNISQLILGNS